MQEMIQSRMTCRKLLSLEPSSEQLLYNLDSAQNLDPYQNIDFVDSMMSSAPQNLDGIIGPESNESIWSRNFKLRLKSTDTSRAIDINFSFILETDDQVPQLFNIFGIQEQNDLTQECMIDKRYDLLRSNQADANKKQRILLDIDRLKLDCPDD